MELSNELSYKLIEVGSEKTVVIVIDNFLKSTQHLVDLATNNIYQKPPENCTYPGVRTPLNDPHYLTLISNIISDIYRKQGVIDNSISFKVDESTLSLLTTKEKDLDPNQCIPHFDGPEQNRLAVLHYLNEGQFGGTAFYRHIPTKFENITPDRVSNYVNSAERFAKEHPFTHKGFFTESTNHFEIIDVIDYVANRLVIYPTSILHSAFIQDTEKNINLAPQKGRLTVNTFVSTARI